MKPFFSILILSWNDGHFLSECLQCLENQTFKKFEVLLLDNGSSPPLRNSLHEEFPALRLTQTRMADNIGFAAGNNCLADMAIGEYLVLLNSDAFPDPDWLEQLYEAAQHHPGAFFASRLLMASDLNRLDGEWNVYHASGMAWRRSHGKQLAQAYLSEKEVWGACAAAAAYPRCAFQSVGGFDPDYFAYMEDIDLDFRLKLQRVPCFYLPQAVVRHVGAGSTSTRSELAVLAGHRNLIWTFIKDMPGVLFWLLLPAHILINLLYLLAAIFVPFGRHIARGEFQAIEALPKVLAKRKIVQRSRKVSAFQIAKALDWNPFSPLIKLTFK